MSRDAGRLNVVYFSEITIDVQSENYFTIHYILPIIKLKTLKFVNGYLYYENNIREHLSTNIVNNHYFFHSIH